MLPLNLQLLCCICITRGICPLCSGLGIIVATRMNISEGAFEGLWTEGCGAGQVREPNPTECPCQSSVSKLFRHNNSWPDCLGHKFQMQNADNWHSSPCQRQVFPCFPASVAQPVGKCIQTPFRRPICTQLWCLVARCHRHNAPLPPPPFSKLTGTVVDGTMASRTKSWWKVLAKH